MFPRRKRHDARLMALEASHREIRWTMDNVFMALAGILSRRPDLAEDLRLAANLTADAPVTEADPLYRPGVVAARHEAAALLMAMAKVVDANSEKAGRVVGGSEAGVQ